MDQKVIYVGEQTCRWVSSTGLLISCRGRNQFSRMHKCAAPSLRHCPRKCVAPSLRHCPTTTKHSGTVKETETVPYNAQCSEWQHSASYLSTVMTASFTATYIATMPSGLSTPGVAPESSGYSTLVVPAIGATRKGGTSAPKQCMSGQVGVPTIPYHPTRLYGGSRHCS
jgi:hypothetical protein